MVKAVVISDEAYSIVRGHMMDTCEEDEAKTMDELFEHADKAWSMRSSNLADPWRKFQGRRGKKPVKPAGKVQECP